MHYVTSEQLRKHTQVYLAYKEEVLRGPNTTFFVDIFRCWLNTRRKYSCVLARLVAWAVRHICVCSTVVQSVVRSRVGAALLVMLNISMSLFSGVIICLVYWLLVIWIRSQNPKCFLQIVSLLHSDTVHLASYQTRRNMDENIWGLLIISCYQCIVLELLSQWINLSKCSSNILITFSHKPKLVLKTRHLLRVDES